MTDNLPFEPKVGDVAMVRFLPVLITQVTDHGEIFFINLIDFMLDESLGQWGVVVNPQKLKPVKNVSANTLEELLNARQKAVDILRAIDKVLAIAKEQSRD